MIVEVKNIRVDDFDFVIVKLKDFPSYAYWVKCGNVINCVTRSDGNYTAYGVGAKKFARTIIKAIYEFNYCSNEDDSLKVIDGGLH